MHEEIVEGTAQELLENFASRSKIQGEFAVFISKSSKNSKEFSEDTDN
jgi:16S rRNA C1402 (ribose-2'-O) methylase RsmI